MAGVFQRILFDKEDQLVPLSEAVENFNDQQIGGEKGQNSTGSQETVKDPKGEHIINYLYLKLNVHLFLLMIAIVLAILTMKQKAIFQGIIKSKNPDELSGLGEGNSNKRWTLMARITIVFICFVLAYFVGLMMLAYVYVAIGSLTDVFNGTTISKRWKDAFITDVGSTWLTILIFAILIVYVGFIAFGKLHKDWYESLYFQSTEKKKDDPQYVKYLYYYGMLIITFVIFFMILMCLANEDINQVVKVFSVISLMAILLLTLMIYKNLLHAQYKKLWLIGILIFLMFVCYPLLLMKVLKEKFSWGHRALNFGYLHHKHK